MPDKIPEVVFDLRIFASLDKYFEYYDNITVTDDIVRGQNYTYKQLMEDVAYAQNLHLRENTWFDNPAPSSLEELKNRTRYNRMDDFNNVYLTHIKPRVDELIKNSKAQLEILSFKYNELGLGMFDFSRASMGLYPVYKFYSFKYEDYVDGGLVRKKKDCSNCGYELKEDGSEVVITPMVKGGITEDAKKAFKDIYDGLNVFKAFKKYGLKIGGSSAFGSKIKKTYLLKENVIKPKNAIRLFVDISAYHDITPDMQRWVGYTAIGIAKLLSIMGYSVSIIGMVGYRPLDGKINKYDKYVDGYRFDGIVLKSFEDTLDASALLYFSSDISFFRYKIFYNYAKSLCINKEFSDYGKGFAKIAEASQVSEIAFAGFGSRDRLFLKNGSANSNSEFLYYVISQVYSEEQMSTFIRDVGLDIVNKNKEARLKLIGHD